MVVDGVLAAESSGPSVLVVVVPALIVLVLLIGAFAWGSRRRRRPPVPPGPAGVRAGSWSTPEGDGPQERATPPRPPHGVDEPPGR